MNTKNSNALRQATLSSLIVGILFVLPISYAQSPTRGELRELRKEILQEKKEQVKEKSQNMLERVKNVIKEKIKRQIKGTLISLAGNVLTVQKDQITYSVVTSDKTQFKRKFGAESTLSEFNPNDQLLIIGSRKKNTDGTLSSSEIEASYIRNMSIQRRFAVFNGEVESVSENTITLKTQSRGTQMVRILSTTEFKEKNVTIKFSDIQEGDKLIVKGELWDRANNNIDAKSILRLPKKNKPTPIQSTQTED